MFGGSEFQEGARRMAPLAVAGVLDGTAFGALAVSVMGHVAPVVMSVTAFSGSAQFATVAVLRDHGTLGTALLSAAALNARYLAMSAAVSDPAHPGTRTRRALSCLLLTDAAWAVAEGSRGRMMGAGTMDLLSWTVGTIIGVLAGGALADPQALGLDAAFPALFLWLLRDQLGPSALLGLALALLLTPLLAPGLPILLAGLAAGALGARGGGSSRAGALGARGGGSSRRSSRLRQAGGTPAPRHAEGDDRSGPTR